MNQFLCLSQFTLSAQPCFINICPFALVTQQALEKSKTHICPCMYTHIRVFQKLFFFILISVNQDLEKCFSKEKVNKTPLFVMANKDKHCFYVTKRSF